MTMPSALRPILALFAAAIASAAVGATLTLGLVAAFGFWEWPFLGWVWLGLAGVGAVLALVSGGVVALVASLLSRRVTPPRPAIDMAIGALTAIFVLMGVRAFAFGRGESDLTWPDPGPILIVPVLAGAVAGLVYWRLALPQAARYSRVERGTT